VLFLLLFWVFICKYLVVRGGGVVGEGKKGEKGGGGGGGG